MLEDAKVVEFAWAGVGPGLGALLASFGARVVRVESSGKPDVLRTMAPYKNRIPGLNRGAFFTVINPNKESLALNLASAAGREVAKKLIGWADLMIDAFTPGTMDGWGLGYEGAKAIRADIIYVSTSIQGATGPRRRFRGFGQHGAALAGFYHLTGHPDRDPAGPYGAYTDFIASLFFQMIALAALRRKHKTGRGLRVELSHLEASLHFLAPVLLDYGVNGRVWGRRGNKDSWACPHDVYPCRGDDAWIAIAVTSDEEWRRLCLGLGNAGLLADARFGSFASRKDNEEALDAEIAENCSRWDAYELMKLLQANGVRAGVVQKMSQVISDPQYKERGRFVRLEHPEMGEVVSLAPAFRLSGRPHQIARAAPRLGEDTEKVLRELLEMSDDEIANLTIEGVLE